MGFPIGYPGLALSKPLLSLVFLLGVIHKLILALLGFLGLSGLIEPDGIWTDRSGSTTGPSRPARSEPVTASLIREMLPAAKFSEIVAAEGPPESCAVCLYDFDGEAEIRRLRNCRHMFHRGCLDRWIDQDQMTCPLCRTPLVPVEMLEAFNERLWSDVYVEYCPIPNFF